MLASDAEESGGGGGGGAGGGGGGGSSTGVANSGSAMNEVVTFLRHLAHTDFSQQLLDTQLQLLHLESA